ncbi:MAG TPA: M20/M25/M40 family metallo-hydrolase [Methylomirabilota bacterium]|jgi:acetylornithine deacetylase|nr:M20/M25/M40 family metallo-hydrolase [Methylomirabilota bacterium]
MSPDALARAAADAVDEPALVDLLARLVRIRSYSAGGEEGRIAGFVAEQLRALGLEVTLQEVQPGRFNCVGRWHGAGGGTSLMLNGHLDTNPAGEGWTRDPLGGEVDDRFVYGIGVSNMKAADAAYVGAVRAVQRTGVRLRGDVVLAFVVGELQGGVGTVHLLQQGVRADRFVVGEPTDLAVLTLHAGSLEFELVTRGRTRHLSKMEEGVDAIQQMVRAMAALRGMAFSGPDDPEYRSVRRLAIGVIQGGLGPEYHDWRPSLLADRCRIRFAVRYGPGQTPDSVQADLEATLDRLRRADPDFVATLRPNRGPHRLVMEPFEVPRDADIVRTVADAHRAVLGAEPAVGAVAPYRFYGTDAAHLSRAGMLGVVYGPGGKYNTMPDERVEIRDLCAAARVYARIIVATCA